MANTKLNVYKMVLQEVGKKFSWAEEYLKNRIKELYDEKKKRKIGEEVSYLFTNYHKDHFECSVISLIFCVMY